MKQVSLPLCLALLLLGVIQTSEFGLFSDLNVSLLHYLGPSLSILVSSQKRHHFKIIG